MRKTYIDNLRWMIVVLVVIYHVIYMFNGVTEFGVIGPFHAHQVQDLFLYLVYPWFMLVLFTVSGMSARYELDRTSHKEFLRKRTRKLLVPSTIGLLVWGWIMGYYNIRIGGGWEGIASLPGPVLYLIMCLSGTGPLWYIQMLWLFSVLLVPLRRMEKDRLWKRCGKGGVLVSLTLTAVIYLAAQVGNVPVITVYRFGIYGAGFLIGYFLFSHDEVMDRLEEKWLLLTIMGIGSCLLFTFLYHGLPYPEHSVLDTPVCCLAAWLGTLGALAFMKKHGNTANRFTIRMKQLSWGLYIFHYLPLSMCAWYLNLYAPGMPAVPVYFLTGAAAIAGSFLLHALICRIPGIRWCILGYRGGAL